MLSFWLVHLAAVVSPGPSFVVVTRAALAGSAARGVAVALGLTLGTLLWALAAWFGLASLFAVAPALYAAVRIAGALFLVFIAWQLWRHARDPIAGPDEASPSVGGGTLAAVRLGLWTQLANPKVAVFFGSIFAAVLPPDPSPAVVVIAFAIVCLDEFVWYAAVALLLARPGVRRRYAAAKVWLDRTAALVLGGLGLRLLAG